MKCPVCGGAMYANVNRKKKKDGTYYKDFFYYTCKHRIRIDGHHCDYHKQWGQDKVNAAVEEVIRKMVNNPKFKAALTKKIGSKIDTAELDEERANLRKQLQQSIGAKNKVAEQMDRLDITDKLYDRKYEDMQKRFLKSFVKDVFIHEQDLEDGRFLKKIRFCFPIFYNGIETDVIDFDNGWDKEMIDETVCSFVPTKAR